MSNYDLQAEVSRLRAKLTEIQIENARLTGEINQGVTTVNNTNRRIGNLMDYSVGTLNQSSDNLRTATSYGDTAIQIQMEIERLYPLFKNMEEANKNIRDLKNKIYYDFATYRVVRKIMQGFMDNLDLSIVNDELIYKAVEKNHLQSSDYWLTSAMLAIMAWKNNQKEMAERAIMEAYDLDKKNTIMFFMIFNLRMGRDETALHWFMEYEKCEMTGEDNENFLMMFSLISKTVMENVSPEVNARITAFVNKITQESRAAAGYSEEVLVNRIAGRLHTMIQAGSYNTPNLASSMGGYGDFTATLDMAANNYNILEKIASILNVSVSERNVFLKEFMDHLLARPNDAEKGTYEQIDFNEAVIRNRGEMAAAQEEFRLSREEAASQINLVANMVKWIGDEGNDSINGQMRRNMFAMVADCEQKGTHRYAENYRARYREVWPITIGEYASTCNFQDEETERSKIEIYYRNWLEEQLSKIDDKASVILFVLAVVIIGVGIYFKAYIPAIVAGLLCAALGGLLIFLNKKKRESLAVEAGRRTENAMRQLFVLFKEFDVLRQKFREFDAVQYDIDNLFTQI